jgi:hypothetical protein
MCVVLQRPLARGPAARPRCIPPAGKGLMQTSFACEGPRHQDGACRHGMEASVNQRACGNHWPRRAQLDQNACQAGSGRLVQIRTVERRRVPRGSRTKSKALLILSGFYFAFSLMPCDSFAAGCTPPRHYQYALSNQVALPCRGPNLNTPRRPRSSSGRTGGAPRLTAGTLNGWGMTSKHSTMKPR